MATGGLVPFWGIQNSKFIALLGRGVWLRSHLATVALGSGAEHSRDINLFDAGGA